MDSVLMLAFLSRFFFFWKHFMENLLNLPKCKLLHVTEPKKIKFLVLQRYPHSDPRKPCNSLPQCNKTERILQCFIIIKILDLFLRTSCTSTSETFASQMKTSSHVIYEETVSLVQVIYCSLKFLRNWSIARESLLF